MDGRMFRVYAFSFMPDAKATTAQTNEHLSKNMEKMFEKTLEVIDAALKKAGIDPGSAYNVFGYGPSIATGPDITIKNPQKGDLQKPYRRYYMLALADLSDEVVEIIKNLPEIEAYEWGNIPVLA